MAPELVAGKQYDAAADIWSFGITALELSQGRPPRSREPSKDVLLKMYVRRLRVGRKNLSVCICSIHETPPTLDRECGVHSYTRSFKDMIDSCLVKDPSKRCDSRYFLIAWPESHIALVLNSYFKPHSSEAQRRRVIWSTQSSVSQLWTPLLRYNWHGSRRPSSVNPAPTASRLTTTIHNCYRWFMGFCLNNPFSFAPTPTGGWSSYDDIRTRGFQWWEFWSATRQLFFIARFSLQWWYTNRRSSRRFINSTYQWFFIFRITYKLKIIKVWPYLSNIPAPKWRHHKG